MHFAADWGSYQYLRFTSALRRKQSKFRNAMCRTRSPNNVCCRPRQLPAKVVTPDNVLG